MWRRGVYPGTAYPSVLYCSMVESVAAGLVNNKLLRSLDSELVQGIARQMHTELGRRLPSL
eukprot:2424673-Karenia_brevis.AAC.1